jgi:hypothetical protein
MNNSLLPQLPTTSSDGDWDMYRTRLQGCVNRSLIDMTEFSELLVISYDVQFSIPTTPPVSTVERFIPLPGHLITLSGSRLREAAVLLIRNSPVANQYGLSAPETLWYLRQAGFSVAGVRPLDVLRKALQQEVKGLRNATRL